MVQRNLQLLLAVRLSFPSIPVAPIWRSRLKRNLSFWQDIGRTGSATEQEAWKAEVPSFDQLYMLLSQTIEAISFVLLLVDYKIGDVVAGSIILFRSVSHCSLTVIYGSCEKQRQAMVATLTHSDLITTGNGRDTARVLLNTVINQEISYQISVDTTGEILQPRCGSLCSADC